VHHCRSDFKARSDELTIVLSQEAKKDGQLMANHSKIIDTLTTWVRGALTAHACDSISLFNACVYVCVYVCVCACVSSMTQEASVEDARNKIEALKKEQSKRQEKSASHLLFHTLITLLHSRAAPACVVPHS